MFVVDARDVCGSSYISDCVVIVVIVFINLECVVVELWIDDSSYWIE